MKHQVIQQLRETLQAEASETVKKSGLRFFKEEIDLYGIKAATVTQIAKKFWKPISNESKETIFSLCELLWKSGILEESFVACHWTNQCRKSFSPDDFTVFERWVQQYINNWASCDTFCNHTMGALIEMYPSLLQNLKPWLKSENRWVRRAAAVSLIVPARKGLFLEEILDIATQLLHDKEDMVQKGYGWLLKVASQKHLEPVFQFVISHKATMPRTALRYAIEKMPATLKKTAMS